MFREFNVKFEDVEMLGGADNLLEGTEITKVIVRGDNNKMSSLDSMLKNCNELDTVEGELDLNGVSDIDNLLEGTELVKSIDLKNINNENISANNSFPHIEEINIGGELYNKKAMQNVIASKDWTLDNINYSGTVGDNIVTKEVNIVDDNKATIKDTLEQKAKGIEIIGQTYENLVVGSGEATLLDELTLESVDGSPKEFNPHLEQPVCVESIEGETYQNLIEGKGEYKLTDAIDERTISESEIANGIENLPSVIEITSLWGNTYQNPNNLNEIVSLGDLYVDESGEPILDEEGNEQYKLELISNDGNSNLNKTTILMPQPLRMLRKYGGLNSDLFDKLYWDSFANKYYIENNIYKLVIKRVNDSSYNGTYFGNIQLDNVEGIDISFLHRQRTVMPFIQKMTYTGWGSRPTNSDFGVGVYSDGDIRIYGKEGISITPDEMNKFIGDGLDFFIERQTPRIIETKILEKPSLEAYSPKTYITTNTEIQPSQMTVTNKKVDFIPLGLQPNKDYTLQLDSVGKNDKPITVNLGGTETTIQPINDTNTHHKVVVRTPSTLTTDKLDLSGEGVVVNDVMLFEGGSNEIKQEVEYVEGIQNIGELQEDGTYKIDILSHNGVKNLVNTNPNNWVVKDSDSVIIKSSIKVNKGKTYTVFSTIGQWVAVYESDLNGNQYNLIRQDNTGNWSFIATSEYIKVSLWNISYVSDKLSQPHNMNVRIFEGCDDYGYNGYEERKLSIQSMLLPQPLNKIGEIKDKFYWDDNKGHYCIEQKFSQETSNFSNWVIKNQNDDFIEFTAKVSSTYKHLGKGVSNILRCYDEYTLSTSFNKEGISLRDNSIFIVLSKTRNILDTTQVQSFISNLFIIWELITPNIIDLPHLNKKYSLDTYMPTTYLECTNSPMQPSRILLESDTVRYKPSALETDTDYTIQFECKEKSDKKVKLNLGGSEKEVDAVVGLNHVSITTSSEIDTSLYKDRLFLSGVGNKVADVIVAKGEMNQYPNYFDGVQSTGELQDDGTYLIGIKTNEGFNISISSNSPLSKGDKLYWNKSNKRYEIDRDGSIEVPTVIGDVIDLPRLYQREDTHFSTSTGNIRPSKIKLDYNDLD